MILKPNILALNTLVEFANTGMALLAGAYDIWYTIIFSIANVVVVPAFLVMANLLNIVHIILLKAVTITPRAKDDAGNTVIFGTPSNAPFESLNTTISSYLEPISLLLILIGIAFLMFIRIFDVVIDDVGVDVQDAQNRLMLAPVLILLWPALANMILAIGHGFTELFLNVTIEYDRTAFSEISDDVSIPPWNQELDFLTYISSLAGNPLESSDTTLSMIFAILIMFLALIPYLLAMIASLFRIFAIYVLYVIGPILISMWAFAWKDLEKMGKRYIRYFVLLALFPVPAALINSLLPVLAFSVENALMAPLNDLPTGLLRMEASPTSPQELGSDSTSVPSSFPSDLGISGNPLAIVGLSGIIRALMILVFPVLVGFAPWVFVVGVDGAMKVAKGAGAATAAVATGGAAAGLAGSVMADKATGGRLSSGAKSLGSSIGSKAKGAAGRVPGSERVGSIGSGKYGTMAKMGSKVAKNHRSKIQRGVAKAAKKRGGGISSMVGAGLEKELEAEEATSKGRSLISDLKEGSELASGISEGEDLDDPEVELLEKRAMRSDMTTSRAKDIIKNSDDLNMSDFDNKSDKELQKIANDHKVEKYKNNTRDELRREFGEKLERNMGNSFKNIKYGDIMDEARKLGVDDEVIQSDVASDYADYQHGIHYNRLNTTMTESDMDDEEKQKAQNDVSNVDARLDSINLDTNELENDDIRTTQDLLSFLEEDRTFENRDSVEATAESMAKYITDPDNRTHKDEEWEDHFEFVDELNSLLEEQNMKTIDNMSEEEVQTQLPQLVADLDENRDLGSITERFLEETLFEQDSSAEAQAIFDTGDLDRNRLMRYIQGQGGRDDNAPLTQEVKTAESLRNPDVSGDEKSYSTQEAVSNVVQNVRREHSQNVAKKVEEEIMELDPSDDVSDIELDGIDAFENLGQAITESLNNSIEEAGYDDYTIDTGEVNNIMSECASHMQTFGEDAIKDLANQTSDMSEELIMEAVNESADLNESQKEEIINKYREEGSLDESDIRSLDLDQAENLQRENFAMKFAEKRVAQVDEDLAEELNIEDILDEYGMNMEVAADRIRRNMEMSDMDTEELAGVVQDLKEEGNTPSQTIEDA